MAPNKLPVLPTGGAFQSPPADAPKEVAQPLKPEAIQEHLAKAAVNEKTLKPLVFEKPPGPGAVPPAAVKAPAAPAGAPGALPTAPAQALAPGEGLPSAASPSIDHAQSQEPPVEVLSPEPPESDTPTHGLPKPIQDPGKQITGGFGDQGQAYFALSGDELRECVRDQFDRLNDQLAKDLRFSIACAYPQVRVRVDISIDGAEGASINDVKFDLSSARLYEAHTLVADTNQTPADALRVAAQLPRPQKQRVSLGAGHQLVDVT